MISKIDEGLQDKIYQYLMCSPNYERSRREIIKGFNLPHGKLDKLINKMTYIYPIYEDDTGKIIGILVPSYHFLRKNYS